MFYLLEKKRRKKTNSYYHHFNKTNILLQIIYKYMSYVMVCKQTKFMLYPSLTNLNVL